MLFQPKIQGQTQEQQMIIPDWLSDLNFAFSRQNDGQMSFKRTEPETVIENRVKFFNNRNLNLDSVVAGEIVHGTGVSLVTKVDSGRGARNRTWIPKVDGLVTSDPGILLLTTHADCAPIIIYNPKHKILGQAHAGWRGLVSGIVENLIETLNSINGSGSGNLRAWIGPTIGACCYEVDVNVAEQFPQECCYLNGGSIRLSLVRFIRMELERLGFNPQLVTDSEVCTSCDKQFSSMRRDGIHTNAMACVTGLP